MRDTLVLAAFAALLHTADAQGLNAGIISSAIARGIVQTLTISDVPSAILSVQSRLNAIKPSNAQAVPTGVKSVDSPATPVTTAKAAPPPTTKKITTTKKTTTKKKTTAKKKAKRTAAPLAKRDNGFSSVGPDGFTTIYGASTFTCTAYNQDTYAVVDQNQVPYLVMCGGSTLGDNIFSVTDVDDPNHCFQFCDAYTGGCTGWDFRQNAGDSTGQCLVKIDNPQTLNSYNSKNGGAAATGIGGVMRAYYSTKPKPTTATTTVKPSSSPTPQPVNTTPPQVASSKPQSTAPQVSTKPSSVVAPSPPAATTIKTTPQTTPQTTAPVQQSTKPVTTPPAQQPTTKPANPTTNSPAAPKTTCTAANPTFYPQPNLASINAFLTNSALRSQALTAMTPPGFSPVFQGYFTSMFANSAMLSQDLDAYDPTSCSVLCAFTKGCVAFNIYFQRDPALEPAPGVSAADCPTSSSVVRVKCSLWSYPISAGAASNFGGWTGTFPVAITGSNAYVINSAIVSPQDSQATAVQGYSGPFSLANGAVNVPANQLATLYLTGSLSYQRWDVAACASQCANTTATNRLTASAKGKTTYLPCNYFNIFALYSSGSYIGMYCQLYTTSSVSSYASLKSSSVGGKSYTVQKSNGYAVAIPDGGVVNTAKKPATTTAAKKVKLKKTTTTKKKTTKKTTKKKTTTKKRK